MKSTALVSVVLVLIAGLQHRSNSQRGTRISSGTLLTRFSSQGTAGCPLESTGCRAGLGSGLMSFFRWKPLVWLQKQSVTAMSLSVMMVLIKISSSLLRVVVLKL